MNFCKRPIFAILLVLTANGCAADNDSGNSCGDDRIDTGEQCDGDRLNGQTCEDQGFTSGVLSCTNDCNFDTSGCGPANPCGNGALDAEEECDKNDLAGKTCEDLGYDGGALACTGGCLFDVSGCEGTPDPCGNGTLDAGEECDGDELDGNSCSERGFSGGEPACNRACLLDWSGCLCDDDDREPNENMSSAVELAPGDFPLKLCNPGGAEDWFSFPLEAGASLAVKLIQDQSDLDLDLILVDENLTILDRSVGAGLVESAWFTAPEALTVYLQVFPFLDQPGSVGYSLRLAVDPECLEHADCPAGKVCRDFACAEWSCSQDSPCPDDLRCHEGHCVECVGDGDCPDHPFIGCEGNRCLFSCMDDSYEPNDASGQAASVNNDVQESGLTLCGSPDRDWFSFELDALHRYGFNLAFEKDHGEVDVFLYAAGDTENPVSIGTSSAAGVEITHVVTADGAGTFLLEVRLRPGYDGQVYDLIVSDLGLVACAADGDCQQGEICADFTCQVPGCMDDTECTGDERCTNYTCVPAPPGDDCAAPISVASLPFSAQDVDITPYRGSAAFDAETCTEWGTAGKDVFYSMELTAGQTLLAEINSTFDAALIILDACEAETCLAGVDSVFGNQTEILAYTAPSDGTYLLIVDTAIGGDRLSGQFDLEVSSQ
ncbi:MAG TPA: hypothetical protein VM425_06695 [Myxococcota bacterium]|nr:hypothetical protein [Myxococcota bacterium]